MIRKVMRNISEQKYLILFYSIFVRMSRAYSPKNIGVLIFVLKADL